VNASNTHKVSVKHILDRIGDQVVTIKSGAAIADAVQILAARKFGALPVIDEPGKLIGILSERDIIRHIGQSGASIAHQCVDDLMTRDVISCEITTNIEDVLTMMSTHSIRHVPVVQNGLLVGLISVRDVLDLQREILGNTNEVLEKRVQGRMIKLRHEISEHLKTQEKLHHANMVLMERMAELEDTKERLEMQGSEIVNLAEELFITQELLHAANKAAPQRESA